MAFISISNPGKARAALALQDAQDRMMEVDELEGKDLPFHTEKEAQRAKVILAMIREARLTMEDRSDRNFYATITIGVLLFTKGIFTVDDIHNVLKFFGWAH